MYADAETEKKLESSILIKLGATTTTTTTTTTATAGMEARFLI